MGYPGGSPDNQRHLVIDMKAQNSQTMLVDYSDSESESEKQKKSTSPLPLPPLKSGGLSALLPKPKGVRKNNGEDNGRKKIIVNLPKLKHDDLEDGPQTKKVRVGGGLGLSAMLPAPKRSGTAAKNPLLPPPPTVSEIKSPSSETIMQKEVGDKAPSSGNGFVSVASSTRFVPQSVARKPIQPTSAFKKPGGAAKPATAKPKISLFGSGSSLASTKSTTKATFTGEYQPIMLTAAKPLNRPKGTSGAQDDDAYPEGPVAIPDTTPSAHGHNGPQDLETIAREAGLDDAAMRQLYGRRGRSNAPINITNYSVDVEYNNNEVSRSLGLLEEVKPVRAIAPGKHQLSSLLNAAQSQRGALEDAFAQGKRNKKEAGSKYGW